MSKDYDRDEDDSYFCFGRWYDNNRFKWRYKHRYASWYCRYPRTTNELRQLICAEHDGEPPIRRRRMDIPTAYDDPRVSRNYGKSWKDYTKKRRQWEDR